ncbi:MAG: hypothetical protein OXE55_02175 [Flavobacteriaceae bacterium]|nr:hypothetical protein [Flavobacteriaceae bacterium]
MGSTTPPLCVERDKRVSVEEHSLEVHRGSKYLFPITSFQDLNEEVLG